VGKASPYLRMTQSPDATAEETIRLNMDGFFDSINNMSGEFKNLAFGGAETQMTMSGANANPKNFCDLANIKSIDPSCLFTSEKCSQAFGSEPKNEIKWDGIIDMTEGTSPQPNDISLVTSGDNSLSISLNTSLSISPVNETCETVLLDVQPPNLQTSSSKGAHVKFGTLIPTVKSNNNVYCSRRTLRKFHGKQSRNSLMQNSWKHTNPRYSNNQRQSYGAKNMRRSLSCKQKSLNKKTRLRRAETPTSKTSWKSFPNKQIGNSCTFEMFTVWMEQNILKHKGKFLAFVTNQEGSRFLQDHLSFATADQLWSTFNHLKPYFVKISHDVFGNYVAQKYLELGCDELISSVFETLQSSILSLSLGIYGCRVVQKLLECAAKKHKQVIAQQFAGSIIEYIYDQNGNHVVQKMIECLNPTNIHFVAEEIVGHSLSLAMHPYGSRVIQRLLEKVSWRRARPLLNEIKQHIITLSKNQYGNYIIQWIIEQYSRERREIFLMLKGHVADLSREKFASNVIERAFENSTPVQLRELAVELLHDDPTENGSYPTLALLVSNQYGNYVIQTLIEASSGAFRERLFRSLCKCGRFNKDYGKNLILEVRRLLRKKYLNTGE